MVAVAWLLYWVITNDKAPKAITTGPYAIREGRPADKSKPRPALRRKKRPPLKPLPRLGRLPPKLSEPPKP
jgi:hypothetical protein